MTDLYKSTCPESGTELGFKLIGGGGGRAGQSSLFKNFKKLEY